MADRALSAQKTLEIWVNRHGRPCDSDRHDARMIEVVPKDEVERLRELLRRCYRVVGSDELARAIEEAVPGV